jgi:pentalenolactone synthase
LPFLQTSLLDIAPELRALQRGAVHRVRTPVGDDAWLVIDYAAARQLLDDERLGRAHPDPDNAPRIAQSALLGMLMGNFETEVSDHAQMRTILQPHFSPRHLQALRPRVEVLTTELLNEVEKHGPPADLHSQLAEPLPILVLCELLGVPWSDRDQFWEWTADVGSVHDRVRSASALGELFGYAMKLVEHKRAHPGDDVISRLCATEGSTDVFIAGVFISLLFAGHEATVVQLGMGILLLLANREQWLALRDQPALMPKAVDELLRAGTVVRTVGGVVRYARSDFDLDGVSVRTGDLVVLDLGSANYDPAVFTDPERLDIARKEAPHLAFGYGLNYCIGASLARIELTTAFTQLIQRFPSMHLACDPAALPVREDALTGGPAELPVSW